MAKRLVVCCDGTWNRPDQLRHGVAAPTNVTKLAFGIAREDGAVAQRIFYQPGVGTRRFERLTGGAFGLGLSRNVIECYRFLVGSYEPGDELYFFGFSRGAFTARSTVGLVRNSGILRDAEAGRITDAYRLYRDRSPEAHPRGIAAEMFRRMYAHPDPAIHFVGVWDTVGRLGIPIDPVRWPVVTRRWTFHDTTLSSHVRFAYQALAIDEERGPFEPTLWQQQRDAEGRPPERQVLEQVWFAGVHSDVGGGYADPALSEIALLWMVERARESGLAFEPDRFQVRRGAAIDPELRRVAKEVAPDALGAIHESLDGPYRLLGRHERRLEADGAAAASSAIRRRERRSDYAPRFLDAFVAGGGRVTPVEDGS